MSLHKHVSKTDVFTQRHWQRRAAIHILKILILSLLLLNLGWRTRASRRGCVLCWSWCILHPKLSSNLVVTQASILAVS
jgi:hypothetical protein